MQANTNRRLQAFLIVVASLFMSTPMNTDFAIAQQESSPSKPQFVIRDEPRTIDPKTIVSPRLTELVTVKFDGKPLKDVFAWLQAKRSLNVQVDYKALAVSKILDTEPVNEELVNAPLYLLLNRLEMVGLRWYEQNDSLIITTFDESFRHVTSVPFHLGDLLDEGYSVRELANTIVNCSGGSWDSGDTVDGSMDFLGDVAFVTQTARAHQEIAGMLSAIRNHGRRTFSLDSPGNAVLRAAMDQKLSIDFKETPLVAVIAELARRSQIDLRLDRASLARANTRERIPISLRLDDQKLSSIIHSLTSNHALTWYLRDEVLWIGADLMASRFHKTAVYDVRDLCRDTTESNALKRTLQKQIRARGYKVTGQADAIEFPHHGTLVVRGSEPTLDFVLESLEKYRAALRMSKMRVPTGIDPTELTVGYYRMPTKMAVDSVKLIKTTVSPETWISDNRPGSVGSIELISSQPTFVDVKGSTQPVENSILVIRQTRLAHRQIGRLIQTLLDSQAVDTKAALPTTDAEESTLIQFGSGIIPSSSASNGSGK